MKKLLYTLLFVVFIVSCKQEKQSEPEIKGTVITATYAKGFEVKDYVDFKVIYITSPWPDADKAYKYLLLPRGQKAPDSIEYDAIVNTPVEKIVVTSTTHIPALEALGAEDLLIGFPNSEYVSSEKTRKRIDSGKVQELGKNESLNTEVLLTLEPDVVVGFAVSGENGTFNTIENAGIPVLYNGDWTESHPLGKAEWIKFFGYLFSKEKEANAIFSEIETQYNKAKKLAQKATNKPTVISGAMYKDVWYLPYGNSWAGQLIHDANGNYLWGDTEGSGSISLNFESVFLKGGDATFWIAPGSASSKSQLLERNQHYEQFAAFKNDRIYNFAEKKGATGGLLYYELAPNRPDLVLKDIIKILHPELLPDYECYFYNKLP